MDGIIVKHYGTTEKWMNALKNEVNYLRNSQMYLKHISYGHQRFLFERAYEVHTLMCRAAVFIDRKYI